MKIRLKNNWFDPNAVRRRPGIIYQVPDTFEEQLPSGTEVLTDTNDVDYVVERKRPQTQQVTEVRVTTDEKAQVETEPTKTEVKDEKSKTSIKL